MYLETHRLTKRQISKLRPGALLRYVHKDRVIYVLVAEIEGRKRRLEPCKLYPRGGRNQPHQFTADLLFQLTHPLETPGWERIA